MILLKAEQLLRGSDHVRDEFRFCMDRTGYWGDGRHPEVDMNSSNLISSCIFDDIKDEHGYRYAESWHNRLMLFQNQVMYYMEKVRLPWNTYYNGGIFHIRQLFAYPSYQLEVGYQ